MPYSDAEEFETEVDAYMKDCELHHEQQVLRENHVYFNTEVVSDSPSGVADRTVLDVLSRNARDKSEIEFCKFLENPNSERILHNWKIMDDLSRRYDKPYHDWMNQNKSRIMASIRKRDFHVCVVDEVANDSDKDTIGTDDELPADVVVKLNAVRDTLLATEVASLTKMSLLTDNVWTLSHLERRIPKPQKITPHQYYIIKRLDILSPEAIVSYEDIMRDRLNKGDRNMVKSVDVFQKATGFNLTTGPVNANVLPPLSSKAHAMADNIVKIPENVDLESTIGKLTSDSDKKFSALETQMSQLATFVQTNATQGNKALEDLKENRNKSTFLRGTVQDARYIPHGNPGLNQNGPMNANIGQLNSPVDALFDTPKSQGVKVDYKLGYYSAAMDPAIQARRDNAYFTEGEMKQELERPPFMNRREMFHTKDRAIPKFKKDKNPIEWFEDFLKYGRETGRGMAEMLYTTLSLCFDGDEKVWFKVNKAKWNTLEDFRVDLFSTFASGTEFHKKRIQVMELEQTFEEDPIMFAIATGKWENFKLYHPEMSKEMRIMTIIKLLNPRYSGLLINCRFPGTDTGFYQLEEQLKQAKEIVTKNKDYMDKLKKERFSSDKKGKDLKKDESKKDSTDTSKKTWGSWVYKNKRSDFRKDERPKGNSSGTYEKNKTFNFSGKDIKKVLALMSKDNPRKEKPIPPGKVMRTSKQAIAATDKIDQGKLCFRCSKPGHMIKDCKESVRASEYKEKKKVLALMENVGLTNLKEIDDLMKYMSDNESANSDVASGSDAGSDVESGDDTPHMPDSIRQDELMDLLEHYGATPEDLNHYVEQYQEN